MKQNYKELWDTVKIFTATENRAAFLSKRCLNYWPLYSLVTQKTGVPEYVIACLDYRESDFDHTCYLANGDPLFNSDGKAVPTAHVPRGLGPASSWVDGAVLSLIDLGLDKNKNWGIASTLYQLEAYNGLGYQRRNLLTPYLWSGTSYGPVGKYTSDGKFDPLAIDKQLGCVPLLKAFELRGIKF